MTSVQAHFHTRILATGALQMVLNSCGGASNVNTTFGHGEQNGRTVSEVNYPSR